VLSIGKLAAGPQAGEYYCEQVAAGREDYYAGEGEAPGTWMGAGGQPLGLGGEVEGAGLEALLRGAHPATDEPLRRHVRDGGVAGFDLTFRAPKSVSIVFGIADAPVAAQLADAHEAAVGQALGYLEREACWARRGKNGVRVVRGGGFVAAAFRHRTSRAGDPLLHTHVVVGNLTRGPDERWTALDARPLYEHAKTAGFLYQAALRAELTARVGPRWGPVRSGTADLEGVSREVIGHFSRRRAEIVAHMKERGERSARAAQVATLETRRAKDYGLPVGRLRAEWRARAAEFGLDRRELRRLLPGQAQPELPVSEEHLFALLEGPDGLTHARAAFTRREVLQALAEAHPQGAAVGDLEATADAFLARETVVELARAGSYTTREHVEFECELIEGAARRRGAGVARAAGTAVERAIAARPTLSSEQQAVVRRLTRDGHGLDVLRAPAGTGKTFALDAAREAWADSGMQVVGCALAARAAAELESQAGIESMTVAALRRDLERGGGLSAGGVLVVDESGMVGTRDLVALARHTEAAGAKLVLVGDDRQLPEIEAGGAFRAVAERVGAAELRTVRRQEHAWDRAALEALRDGDVERWARAYRDQGRVTVGRTSDEARSALVNDWWQARTAAPDEDGLMVAHRRSDVADLNSRARALLHEAGELHHEVELGARAFAVGDRVVALRNDRALGMANGHRGTVTGIEGGCLRVAFGDGDDKQVPFAYAEEGHLDHGYATTAHKAQGATVDRAFVLGSDELYREWGYTALSRHRAEARFYVTAPRPFLNREPERLVTDEAVVEQLTAMLGAERAQDLASDSVPAARRARLVAEEAGRAEAARRDYEEAAAATRMELEETRWWRRREREELTARLATQERAETYWAQQVDGLGEQVQDLADEATRPQPRRFEEHALVPQVEPPNLAPDLADTGLDL
jgi:conjugative relaxase-like TrwC/TraI family protein